MCVGSTKIAAPTVILKMAAASPRTPMTRRSAGSAAAGTGAAMQPRYRKGGPWLRAPLLSSYLARASEPVIPSLRSGQALSAAGAKDLLFGPITSRSFARACALAQDDNATRLLTKRG